jgi:hypothetical protein
MDFETFSLNAMYVAIFMVGITQMVKTFLNIKNVKLKAAITLLVGLAGGALLYFKLYWIFITLSGISIGVVFYDSVLKLIENLIAGIKR